MTRSTTRSTTAPGRLPTGITPPGIPGFKEDICKYCAYDPDAAQKAFDDWKAAGNSLTEPITIQFNAGAGHEDVVQIIIDNLNAIGIDAEADPGDARRTSATWPTAPATFCRSGWFADYPTYDNFMFDLFSTDSLGGNNYGFYQPEVRRPGHRRPRPSPTPTSRPSSVPAGRGSCSTTTSASIPINWYRGDYVYNAEDRRQLPADQPLV